MFTNITINFYQAGQSIIHKLDARVKILGTIGLILSNVLLPDGAWLAFIISFIALLIITRLANIAVSFVLKRSLVALPFVLVAITILFTLPGTPLLSINIFSWQLQITDTGLLRFTSIIIRAWLSVQAAILLTATSRFPDIAHGLRHLKIPLVLIAILSFMYRYLFVLSEEAVRLMQGRAARSASLPDSPRPPLRWQAKNAGNMVGQLFLRSYERSDRVYNAMVARGFQGQFLTLTPHVMESNDWLALAITLSTLSIIQITGHFL
jgi:cobalt/nickel transport system permease protein